MRPRRREAESAVSSSGSTGVPLSSRSVISASPVGRDPHDVSAVGRGHLRQCRAAQRARNPAQIDTERDVTLRHGHATEDRSSTHAAVAPGNPNFPASTGGNGVVHSTPPTGRRDTPRPVRAIAIGNGMMTIDMDHSAPQRRSAGSPVSAPRIDGPPRGTRQRPAPVQFAAPRRLAAGVLAGALTMLVVALLDTVTGAQVPVLGSFASLPSPAGQPEVVELAAPPATPGTCLNWTRADASDTHAVDCTQAHLFEQAGTVLLADQTELPDDGRWRQLVRERCDPVVKQYLGGRFDPDGRFRIGALKPSPAKWTQGDRELRCGLQSASRSGALYPMAGKAVEQDQSAVHAPGTCLGIDGRTIGDPVDCAGPHAVEAVGVVDLAKKFDAEVRHASSRPSTRRTSSCRPSARRSPPRTRAATTSSARRSSPSTGTTSPRTPGRRAPAG